MKRENFNSRIGSVLALAGSAVGLGNIWRFPYMLNEYGGGAFLLIYLICIVVVSLPIMMSEFIVGRRSRSGAFNSIRALQPTGAWKYIGVLLVFIPAATLCYYCVIGGWTLDYFVKSLTFTFNNSSSPEEIESLFGQFVSSPVLPLFFHGLFLLATALIIRMGVKQGIEKCSKVMMPTLFIIIVFIAIWSICLPRAGEGLKYLFKPDFSKITPEVCLAAMGQSFYSLSIGMGIMITYSSYFSKDADITKTAALTISSDFIFAIIAGSAIIPALFAYGLPSGQGTGLVFKTLPVVFSQMPLGGLVSIIFFFAVLLAALTSAMSLFEVPVSWLTEQKGLSRNKACIIVYSVALVFGAVCSLSFGVLNDITICGKTIFDFTDYTIGNYLMPLGGLLLVLFVGWKMKRDDVVDELYNSKSGAKHSLGFRIFDFIVKFVSPAAILAIFLSGIIG